MTREKIVAKLKRREAEIRAKGVVHIISEASRHIPAKDKADHPQIPWKDIAGIR